MQARVRSLLVVSCALASSFGVTLAHASDKHACLVASDAGQAKTLDGKLLEARRDLLTCADASCPEIVRTACADWLTALDARIPTVVLHVHEPTGEDAPGVRVLVDGTPVASKDGIAIEVDPGPHRFRFVAGDGRIADRDLVVAEGQKLRSVDVALPARVTATTKETVPAKSPPWAAWGASAVAGAAWLTFAGFAVSGHLDYRNLESTCGHSCDASQYPSAKFIVADVALGVAVVATGVAAVLFLTHASDSRPPARSASFYPGFRF